MGGNKQRERAGQGEGRRREKAGGGRWQRWKKVENCPNLKVNATSFICHSIHTEDAKADRWKKQKTTSYH